MAPDPTARQRLSELFAKVDTFFGRAAARYPGDGGVTCRAGCDDCCQRRFSVTTIEASAMAEAIASLTPEARAVLAERAHDEGRPGCPALESDGRCAAYSARPLICRTHGLVLRFRAAEPAVPGGGANAVHLPLLDTCPKNFTAVDLTDVTHDCVLDQGTLSTILGAIDSAHVAETGGVKGARIAIAALF